MKLNSNEISLFQLEIETKRMMDQDNSIASLILLVIPSVLSIYMDIANNIVCRPIMMVQYAFMNPLTCKY